MANTQILEHLPHFALKLTPQTSKTKCRSLSLPALVSHLVVRDDTWGMCWRSALKIVCRNPLERPVNHLTLRSMPQACGQTPPCTADPQHTPVSKGWMWLSAFPVFLQPLLQACTDPEGSRTLRIPDFMTISTWRWWGCQPYALAAFTPRKYP